MGYYFLLEIALLVVCYFLFISYNQSYWGLGETFVSVFSILGVSLAGVFVILRVRKMIDVPTFRTCFMLAIFCMLLPTVLMLFLLRILS
ncbi:hypothetical protein GA0116948_109149 [Chitinophaga costaii]|uniref:Uncharacterized protein n=2 Tax=Chitinophaga costaii TaxID=1335309 RepID=A0A1C4ERX7_9BACT|nr:hypothetical protein DCM91_14885 [Chitinophaga costaii]SCC46303.1 hypothetical protein GA0116948_109149 [Chitinophaga costaii]